MEVVIAKHSVAVRPEDGLSPLQYQLLTEPKRIRIVDAPTGSGKSYAFQKALLDEKRVLFIVPTRRLAQNLAAGLINDLVNHEGWSASLAERKVAIFSSDQTQQLIEQGKAHISGYRLRQLDALHEGSDAGEMIIAVPEVISHLLHRDKRAFTKGSAGEGVFSLLSQFDHIVFDEFHTIAAQGFGLAAVLAKLVSVELPEGGRFGCAKLSFLSATPLKTLPTLEKLGIAPSQVACLQETLVDDDHAARPLHGDVCLSLLSESSLPACLQPRMPLIQKEVQAQRQVVIIYDALHQLRRDLPSLKVLFQQANITPNQVLVINSIDDSGSNRRTSYGFASGRQQNPDDFNILIATASVEMGVTFRAANVMFMEPGFAPMNFLQRYGRAARRGQDGQVFVRIGDNRDRLELWLRKLYQWVEHQQGQTVSITALSQLLSQTTQERFDTEQAPPLNAEANTPYFGSLSHYANYASGLYWQLLIQHPSNKGYRAAHLREHQPPSSAHIYKLLQAISPLLESPDYQRYAKRWYQWFMQRALLLRDIGKRITVIEGDGFQLQVDRVWLARETTVLNFVRFDEQGHEYCQLEGELDDYLLPESERQRIQRRLTVYFPHKPQSAELKADTSLVRVWLAQLENKRCSDTEEAWEDYPEAMQAVNTLVRLTGCVAGHDVDIAADAVMGVLG